MKTMKTMKKNLSKIGIIAITTLSSCDLSNPQPETSKIYEDGYFVTNEGNFGQGNGSISFVSNFERATPLSIIWLFYILSCN